jgi:hypothetical protein
MELIMSEYDNLTEDHERAVAERDRLVGIFGEDITIGLATDEPARSRRPSSAQAMVKDRDEALAELRREDQARDMATVQALARDRAAFERVEAGQGTEQDRIAAHRHATRHGLIPKRSTVEKLIAQGERQRRS